MIKLSLSRAKSKIVPESMELPDGRTVKVNADFRCVLKCLRTLKNPAYTDAQKEAFISLYFFNGIGVFQPCRMMEAFLSDGTSEDMFDDPVMDFEQDADVIYASFLQEYGIDLIDVPYLHWNKFKALLSGLGGDTALGKRIALREMDTSKLPPKEKAKAERAKRRVQLEAEPLTKEEKRLQKLLDDALAEGRDPSDAVKALNDYYKTKSGGIDG